jgi:CubicO group peptidase (beta-lactamase class C family)
MLKTRAALTLLAAAGLAVFAGCASSAAQPDPVRALDAYFSELHARGLFDGAVVVGNDREILWEKGFGFADAERRVPFTPDTPADGGSLAKTFTAALLIQLQEEGLLDLDDPARRLLPELPYEEITLRHFLSHSSGLPFNDYGEFDPYLPSDRVRTTEALLGVIADQKRPLKFTPGSAFEYSSLGYDLAALAAARATRKTYAELMVERYFRPLGITSAFIRPARFADFPGVRTRGYRRNGGKLEPNEVFDFEGFHGGSNIYISARDLHRWNASFFDRSVWKEDVLAEALQYARIGDSPSGLTTGSWYRSGDGSAYWYSGHLQGFHDEVFRDLTTRRSIVYVSNNTIEPWLQKAIVRSVNTILDGSSADIAAPATEEIAKEARPSLAGLWELSGGERLEIVSDGDALYAVRGGVRYRMFGVGPGAFYCPGLDPMIGFARGESGEFSRIHISSNLEERWGSRVRR